MATKRRSEAWQAKWFGVILGLMGAVLATWLWYAALVVAAAALAAPACAFLAPALWLRLFRLWMIFAEAIGWVMTRVILALFFYLILTPVGLVMKVLGKAPLDLRWRDGRESYWVERNDDEPQTVERYSKQF